MIIIHAFMKIKPESRDKFFDLTKPIIMGSQAEEGNITYRLYESTEEINTFVFLEEWEDQDAVNFHNDTPHFKEFIEKVQDHLVDPPHVNQFEASEKI